MFGEIGQRGVLVPEPNLVDVLVRVLRELGRVATSDLRKCFDDRGQLRPISELPDDVAAAARKKPRKPVFPGFFCMAVVVAEEGLGREAGGTPPPDTRIMIPGDRSQKGPFRSTPYGFYRMARGASPLRQSVCPTCYTQNMNRPSYPTIWKTPWHKMSRPSSI